MRKKTTGAPSMDFEISPEDRIGGAAPRGRKAKPVAKSKAAKPSRQKGQRVEPGFGGGFFTADEQDEPPRRGGRAPKAKKQPRGKKQRKPFSLWRLFGRLLYWLTTLGVVGAICVAGIVYYYWMQMPAVSTWAVPERPANIRVVAADGQLISNRGKMGGEAVALGDLPDYVPEAFIAIEDKRFYQHFGIDVMGLGAVALESLKAHHVTRGASTLTQQLAKNLFLSPDQTLGRKVQEALLAIWLEHNYTKDQILDLYLNRVFFGNNATGIEAAAQTYFGKSAKNLSLGEAAILAGSMQAPSVLNPKGEPKRVEARQKLVLQAMADQGYITQKEADGATIDPGENIRTKVAGSESYVADWVEQIVQSYVGDVKEDIVVYTTINWDLQKAGRIPDQGSGTEQGPKYQFQPGRAGGRRYRWRRARGGRRRRLHQEPVQPRGHLAAPAGLDLQALRLHGGDGKGLHARHHGGRRPDQHQWLVAGRRR